MGSSWELSLNCAHCNHLNKNVWYAPSSDVYTFKCEKCGEENYIVEDFRAIKVEEPDGNPA